MDHAARRSWLEALGAAGVMAALLLVEATTPPSHLDTARDLLLARDCAAGLGCHGPPASFHGLDQGAGWIRLLALLHSLGPVGIHRLMVALDAASVGAMFLVAGRHLERRAALLATIAFGVAIRPAIGYPVMWSPAIAPLAIVGFYAALYAFVARGGFASLAGAVVSLAWMLESHFGYLAYAPLLFFTIIATAPRPWAAPPVAAAGLVGIELLISREATIHVLSRSDVLLPGVIAAGIAGLATWRLRPRVMALSPDRRAELVTLSCVPYVAAAALGLVLTGHQIALRYFAPVLVPGALLFGALAAKAPRRVLQVGVAVVTLVTLTPVLADRVAQGRFQDPLEPSYDMGDTQRISAALQHDGFAYADVRRGLRGPSQLELLGSLATVWLHPFAPPHRRDDIRILRMCRSTAPADFQVLPSGPGCSVLVGPLASWLHPERMQACVDGRCTALTSAAFSGGHELALLSYPQIDAIYQLTRDVRGPVHLVQRIPVEITGPDPVRVLATFKDLEDSLPAWTITRVDGIDHRGHLPGTCVTLVSTTRRTGTIELVRDLPEGSGPLLVAGYVETRPDEQSIRDALAPRGAPRCAP